MRHLMWILTWIAVGIGGALGAASVVMLSASRPAAPAQPGPGIMAPQNDRDPVLVARPRHGNPQGNPGRSRPAVRPVDRASLTD